jgi:hypothetical protein
MMTSTDTLIEIPAVRRSRPLRSYLRAFGLWLVDFFLTLLDV